MKTMNDPTVHEVLREIPYGLYIVGVRGGTEGDNNALVVSWLTQCSFDPPLIMMAVRRGTRSYDMLKEGGVFSINLLDKKDQDLARQFVKPSDRVGDKMSGVEHGSDKTGAPILQRAFACIECKVREMSEPGDHAIVIGEVVNARRHGTGESLTCSDLQWHYAG